MLTNMSKKLHLSSYQDSEENLLCTELRMKMKCIENEKKRYYCVFYLCCFFS